MADLNLDVYTSPMRELPNGGQFSPTTSTLLTGPSEAVLVDAQYMYWAFGADDALLIVDLPDNVAAAALATAVGSSGAVKSYETVALLTAEEMDRAGKMTVDYRPPGR